MALSGSVPSDFSSASCSRVNRLEVSFFIGFPFVGGGLPRTDDAANRFALFEFGLRPCMNYKQQNRSDKPDGVPAIAFRMQVGFRCMERVFKRQHGRLECK